MTDWSWNGARWWKFDFHVHTPASDDYGRGDDQSDLRRRSPREWLLDHMRAGIDCVGVTDHNTGAWIDPLKEALAALREERPDGFRPLTLFPGVEISVNGGIHVLAIFDEDATTSAIDSLLGKVDFPDEAKGTGEGVTERSFGPVVSAVDAAGGIAIPAHVDGANGLFEVAGGPTLRQTLSCEQVFAMEVLEPAFVEPGPYEEAEPGWTQVLGSDSHHPRGEAGQRFPGSHFTWVKMGSPSLEGLRLALLDGRLSVRRSDEDLDDPNRHGPLVLESLEVENAHYMGQEKPFQLSLNPWLNAIVGGRGTGKSTLVEFARLALRRDNELPEELEEEFEKYRSVYPDESPRGLLRKQTTMRLIYRKDGSRFRVQWSPTGDLDPIQEQVDGEWARAEGDIRQRFPVRMYSQKQIFHLAGEPLALLRVVDDAPEVEHRSWARRIDETRAQFLSLRARAREIEAGAADETALRGELDDVKRRLAVFEEAGHADVLKAFQRRSRQRRAVEAWEEEWTDLSDRLERVAADIVPDQLDDASLDSDAEEDADLLDLAAEVRERLEKIRDQLRALAADSEEIAGDWNKKKEASEWKASVDAATQALHDLRERLEEQDAGDPAAYGELVQRRQTIEQRLKELAGRREQAAELRRQATDRLETLLDLRRGLRRARQEFLEEVLRGNEFVRIEVLPYGATQTVETEFRQIIQKEDGTFEKDIGSPDGEGLLGRVYERDAAEGIESGLAEVKRRVREIAEGRHDPGALGDQRFAAHVGKLNPESLDRLDAWFPEDSLHVEYSAGNGGDFRPIDEGSPGQRTAALLAFLLSYGEEPLVLDQPEDDLDNHLIYDLIVTQLRKVKTQRQVITVTHNPNIVVNGDAELVLALAARGGETRKECEGSLQAEDVRETICDVMEGGREAFEERYRRISWEGRRAR